MKSSHMQLPSEPRSSRRELSAEEKAALREAEADAAEGRVVDFADVKAWVDSWGTPSELPSPGICRR